MKQIDNVVGNLPFGYYLKKFGDWVLGHFTEFDSTGHQTMAGDARPWRDELGDALSLRVQGTGVAPNVTEATIEFATNADLNDYIYKNQQLNHDRDETSTVYPHVHFFQTTSGVPNFLLDYRWQKNEQAKTTGWTRVKFNYPEATYTGGTLNQICSTVSGLIPPSGSVISDIIQFKLYRDNANASGLFDGLDPVGAAVGVLSFDTHIQLSSLGSTEQYVK